jgi:hypothetical protein
MYGTPSGKRKSWGPRTLSLQAAYKEMKGKDSKGGGQNDRLLWSMRTGTNQNG